MILMLSNMYPSAKYPNYGVFVRNLYNALDKQLPMRKVVLYKHVGKARKIAAYLSYFTRSFFAVMSPKTQVVFISYASYNAFPTLVARALGRRPLIITNLHGSDVTTESSFAQKMNFLTAKIIKHSDLVIVPSQSFKDMSERKYGYSGAVISPSGGVDTTYFKPQNVQKDPSKLEIGYISRIDANKGWDVTLQAVAKLAPQMPNLHVTMVGGGVSEADCAQMIKDLHLEKVVTRIKMLPQKDLLGQYSKLDLLVFPGAGTATGESLGLVGLEAMACGVPVLGANLGGIATYVKEGVNGMLFDRHSADSLADGVKRFAALSSEERSKLATGALATAQEYDAAKVNAKLTAFLEEKYGALVRK
jgi:glycosyltransferase involved in cell wall biosynthesis